MALRSSPVLALLLVAAPAAGQVPDKQLLGEISRIRAVDGHSHLRASTLEPEPVAHGPERRGPATLPLRLRADGPEWQRAWRALYAVNLPDANGPHGDALEEARTRTVEAAGPGFAGTLLDRAGVELAFIAGEPTPGLQTPRFRYVARGDVFLRPFSQEAAEALKPFFIAARLYTLPKTLDEFLKKLVSLGLERWAGAGVLGVDLAIAETRALDFADVNAEVARAAYGRLVVAGELGTSAADLKSFQDFTMRHLAREAGRLGLVLHVHTGLSRDSTANVANGNPLLLEPLISDPTLQRTRFLLVHGGYPFDKETGLLLLKPNVWVDVGGQDLRRSPTEVGETLRRWFETAPEKVLFATDASSDAAAIQLRWPELTWLGTETTRQALALALGRMVNEGLVTRARALEIARGVLRDNALALHAARPTP